MSTLPDLSALFNLRPDRAADFLAQKGLKLTGPYWQLDSQGHATSFTVANLAKADVLADIKAAVQEAIDKGETQAWFDAKLTDILKAKGWWGPTVKTSDVTGAPTVVQQGSTARLQTIYRTNLQSAYMAGRDKQAQEQIFRAPYAQYIAVMDARTRPAHAALNGKVFLVNSDEYQAIAPPRGYNCRCRARYLSQAEIDARGLSPVQDVQIESRTVPGDPATGRPDIIQRGISLPDGKGGRKTSWTDPGWDSRPASSGADQAIADTLAAKQETLGVPPTPVADSLSGWKRWAADPRMAQLEQLSQLLGMPGAAAASKPGLFGTKGQLPSKQSILDRLSKLGSKTVK